MDITVNSLLFTDPDAASTPQRPLGHSTDYIYFDEADEAWPEYSTEPSRFPGLSSSEDSSLDSSDTASGFAQNRSRTPVNNQTFVRHDTQNLGPEILDAPQVDQMLDDLQDFEQVLLTKQRNGSGQGCD